MKRLDLPERAKATFGAGSQLGTKLLTPDTPWQEKHILSCLVSSSTSVPFQAHSILRFASQNYHSKSRIPDPDPCLTGGLG